MSPANLPEKDPHWLHNWLTAGKRTWPYEKQFGWSILGWALVLSVCMYALRNNLVTSPVSWVVALLPMLVAIAPLRAYFVFMQHADELIRKIQIEAIVASFTVGLGYGIARTLFEAAGMETASAGDTMVIMLFTLGFAQLYGAWKYR